jgi:hypothetical protein
VTLAGADVAHMSHEQVGLREPELLAGGGDTSGIGVDCHPVRDDQRRLTGPAAHRPGHCAGDRGGGGVAAIGQAVEGAGEWTVRVGHVVLGVDDGHLRSDPGHDSHRR